MSLNPNIADLELYHVDNTSLTIKISAMNAIFVLSRNLGKSFYPYIKPTIKIIIKYFNTLSGSIFRKALKTVKNLVMACDNEGEVVEILNGMLPHMLNLLTITIKEVEDGIKYFLLIT